MCYGGKMTAAVVDDFGKLRTPGKENAQQVPPDLMTMHDTQNRL